MRRHELVENRIQATDGLPQWLIQVGNQRCPHRRRRTGARRREWSAGQRAAKSPLRIGCVGDVWQRAKILACAYPRMRQPTLPRRALEQLAIGPAGDPMFAPIGYSTLSHA